MSNSLISKKTCPHCGATQGVMAGYVQDCYNCKRELFSYEFIDTPISKKQNNMDIIRKHSGLGYLMVIYNDIIAMEDLHDTTIISHLTDEQQFDILTEVADSLGYEVQELEYQIREIVNNVCNVDIF